MSLLIVNMLRHESRHGQARGSHIHKCHNKYQKWDNIQYIMSLCSFSVRNKCEKWKYYGNNEYNSHHGILWWLKTAFLTKPRHDAGNEAWHVTDEGGHVIEIPTMTNMAKTPHQDPRLPRSYMGSLETRLDTSPPSDGRGWNINKKHMVWFPYLEKVLVAWHGAWRGRVTKYGHQMAGAT
jgi:hypothetical protein